MFKKLNVKNRTFILITVSGEHCLLFHFKRSHFFSKNDCLKWQLFNIIFYMSFWQNFQKSNNLAQMFYLCLKIFMEDFVISDLLCV